MKDFLEYSETPLQEIDHPLVKQAGLRLLVKREDLNHPVVSGNKWWKLKYNLIEAKRKGYKTLLTFGGAFSNHIYSTAGAAHALGLNCIGIIRGEETLPLNPTLRFAKEKGMQLHYVSRSDYRKKAEPQFIKRLQEEFGEFYPIPEGGTNLLAIKGCAEFAASLAPIPCDYICLPVGTAGTISGLIAGFKDEKEIIGIPVFKNGEFLQEEIRNWLTIFSGNIYGNWSLRTSYHHGGYAKVTPELLEFISTMKRAHNLPLDPVYTGKLCWAIFEEIRKNNFKKGSTILAIHTGGLQGATTILNQYEKNST